MPESNSQIHVAVLASIFSAVFAIHPAVFFWGFLGSLVGAAFTRTTNIWGALGWVLVGTLSAAAALPHIGKWLNWGQDARIFAAFFGCWTGIGLREKVKEGVSTLISTLFETIADRIKSWRAIK